MEKSKIDEMFSRSRMLMGEAAFSALRRSRVILFGVGGVGGWAAEALVRTGLGRLTIVDFDSVAPSNINRQMPAVYGNIGMSKVEAARSRLLAINPSAEIVGIDSIYSPDTASEFRLGVYDYVIDAIDSLRDKALLINNATRSDTVLFSSMGAALKTDPTKVSVAEFWKVDGCRLAAALRLRFRKAGEFPARKFKCVYSPELVENRVTVSERSDALPINKPVVNGSLMQITCTFGMTLASLVVSDLMSKH